MKSLQAYAATAALIAFSPALGQPAKITSSADSRFVIYESAGARFTPLFYHPSGKITFFSNLGTKYPKGVYYPFFGYAISGSGSLLGHAAWDALSFVPSVSGNVTEIATGVDYIKGANAVKLVMWSDNGGEPGSAIRSWKFENVSGLTCCRLIVGHAPAGIPVAAGTQYWVGLEPVQANSDSYFSWPTNTTDEVDPMVVASYLDGVWSAQGDGNVPALGIFGH